MTGVSADRARTADRYSRHVNTTLVRLSRLLGGLVETESSGCLVTVEGGDTYLDCGGYAVFLLGHRHPRVVAAVHQQIDRHPLATRLFLEGAQAEAAEALAQVTPAGLDYVSLATSGAEATETALKLARSHGRRRLIAMHGGYHGKTLGALSATGKDLYRRPFLPLLEGVTHVPFGDLAALGEQLSTGVGDSVILEPILGEGGVVLPPDGYLEGVSRLCERHDAFLIVDEIQTGLGRTGRWWAGEPELTPDVLLVGKALSGGVVPVAAAVATAKAYKPFNRDPFLHSSTFAGAPLAAAAATASIRVLQEEQLVARAERLGRELLVILHEAAAPLLDAALVEIRGRGLLIGLDFRSESLAGEFLLELVSRRVIANHSQNAQRVVRFTPPAVMTDDQVAWLGEAVAGAAETLAARFEPAPRTEAHTP